MFLENPSENPAETPSENLSLLDLNSPDCKINQEKVKDILELKIEYVTEIANSIINKMVNFIELEYFNGYCNFNLKSNLNYYQTDYRYRSMGGRKFDGTPFISIVITQYVGRTINEIFEESPVFDWPEYKSFSKSPIIGSLLGVSMEKAISANIAHEISHAVQYFNNFNFYVIKKFKLMDSKNTPHGKFWKLLYGGLREEFVNRLI